MPILKHILLFPAALLILVSACLAGLFSHRRSDRPSLVWGSEPIANLRFWSESMKLLGYSSETFTVGYYAKLHNREDWDVLLEEKFGSMPHQVKLVLAFVWALFRYDIFFFSFSGLFIGRTPLWRIQALAFTLARKKVVVIPFGSDYFCYRNVRSISTLAGLMMSYPEFSRDQDRIERQVKYWAKNADFIIPGFAGPEGLGRWDVLMPSAISIDIRKWGVSKDHGSLDQPVRIAHAPNHRGFKGTEFVLEAVEELKAEGLNVELVLIEGVKNDEVRTLFAQHVDILVEQLIVSGHGLNAVEGMASGLCVIANLEDDDYFKAFRRWSFLDECPIVAASPETIRSVLRRLVANEELRQTLGKAGRKYAEKYHSFEASQFLFTEVIAYLEGERDSLINLYHPLLGPRAKTVPKISHPLVNSRLPDQEC